jgi:hypothetical protein
MQDLPDAYFGVPRMKDPAIKHRKLIEQLDFAAHLCDCHYETDLALGHPRFMRPFYLRHSVTTSTHSLHATRLERWEVSTTF